MASYMLNNTYQYDTTISRQCSKRVSVYMYGPSNFPLLTKVCHPSNSRLFFCSSCLLDCNCDEMPSRPEDPASIPVLQANLPLSGAQRGSWVQLLPRLPVWPSMRFRHEERYVGSFGNFSFDPKIRTLKVCIDDWRNLRYFSRNLPIL